MRGRPPITRARVLNYIDTHQPKTIMQIVRATGADRRHVYRILHAVYGPHFRDRWDHNDCEINPAYLPSMAPVLAAA